VHVAKYFQVEVPGVYSGPSLLILRVLFPLHDAAARLAPYELLRILSPAVAVRRPFGRNQPYLAVFAVGPEDAVASAHRTITVRQTPRSSGHFDFDRTAMAGSREHEPVLCVTPNV
jgi:hypothetical protein